MAIVKMNKFTMFAFESQKETLLKKLQQFEGVQFISLQGEKENHEFLMSDSADAKVSLFEGEITKVNYTLSFIKKYIPIEKGIKALKKGKRALNYEEVRKAYNDKANWNTLYESVKNIDNEIISYKNEILKLEAEIENLKPWIKFDAPLSDLKNLSSCVYMFGTIPKKVFENFKEEFFREISQSYIEELGESKDGINILMIIHKDIQDKIEEIVKNYSFNKANINYDDIISDIIKEKDKKIKQVSISEKKIIDDIPKKFKYSLEELELFYEYFDLEVNKAKVCSNFIKTDKIVALQGWVPIDLKEKFEKVTKDTLGDLYYLEFQEPIPEDDVPILLKNNSIIEPYELITAMYSMPSYSEIDPTPILAPFFFIFFGMMLSDAGYGLLILVGSALAIKLFNLDKGTKKFMKLFFSIGISTVIWGILYGSYFGDAPTLFFKGGIKPLWLDPASDPMSVLAIAAIMGVIHLFTGLGIKAYELIRDGKILDALFDVGFWYATISGAIMLLVGPMLGMATLGTIGKYLLIVGALGLVLTQGRSNKGIGAKLAGGLFGLYGITGYLGDILSYSRLLALGLATGLIGSSFNLMIKLLGNGAVAIIFGTLIFVGGHLFNLAINALGAYVHACRLQYLEFFGKFYVGGGKAFTPFKSKNKYINVVKED